MQIKSSPSSRELKMQTMEKLIWASSVKMDSVWPLMTGLSQTMKTRRNKIIENEAWELFALLLVELGEKRGSKIIYNTVKYKRMLL
jgi:hypothetical protein